MKYYAVYSRYYKNGEMLFVNVKEIEKVQKLECVYEEYENFDLYIHYFNTKEEAINFLRDYKRDYKQK